MLLKSQNSYGKMAGGRRIGWKLDWSLQHTGETRETLSLEKVEGTASRNNVLQGHR